MDRTGIARAPIGLPINRRLSGRPIDKRKLKLTIRSGLVSIDGRSVPLSSLSQELADEKNWRDLWCRDCFVHFNVTDDVDIQAVFKAAADAGVGMQTLSFDSDVIGEVDIPDILKAAANTGSRLRQTREFACTM
jgi:hypothetical protein